MKILQSSSIPLFWWNERKFHNKKKENYGDLLSKYLFEKMTGRKIEWVHPRKQPWYRLNKKNYLGAGSIIHHATEDSIVWGSGIIDQKQKISKAVFKAVRGPQTRKFLMNIGYDCPKVYGDPALLLPKFFNAEVKVKYKLGIIPHYHDFEYVAHLYKNEKDILIVNIMTLDVEDVTNQIVRCEKTISSSLHGVIVSHSYGIPSIWVEFSKKIFGDGIKYKDYLESVELPFYQAPFLKEKKHLDEIEKYFTEYPTVPLKNKLEKLRAGLVKSFPLAITGGWDI